MFSKYGGAVLMRSVLPKIPRKAAPIPFKVVVPHIKLMQSFSLFRFGTKTIDESEFSDVGKNGDMDLEIMSSHDKLVRFHNIKQNIEENFSSGAVSILDNINKDKRLIRLVDSICKELDQLSTHNIFFFIKTFSFYEIQHKEIGKCIGDMILTKKIDYRDSKNGSILLYFFAKSRYQNVEVLRKLEDVMGYKNENTHIGIAVKDFWCFCVLGFNKYSTKYIEHFNNKLLNLTNYDYLIDKDVCISLLSYSLINKQQKTTDDEFEQELLSFDQSSDQTEKIDEKETPEFNVEAIKILIKLVINRITNFNYYNITVVLQSLARMNIRNEKIFTEVANKIMQDIQNDVKINIKPKEIAQIFSSFVKVEFFNLKLMRVLEDLFVLSIKEAVPKTVVNMLLGHSQWAQFIVNETFVEKSSTGVFKNFKEYHIKFVNFLLTDIQEKGVEDIDYNSVYLLIGLSNLKHLKDRTNARQVFDIGIKGIDVLVKHLKTLEQQQLKDIEIMKYYSNLSKVTLNKKQEEIARKAFESHNINIEETIVRVEKIVEDNK